MFAKYGDQSFITKFHLTPFANMRLKVTDLLTLGLITRLRLPDQSASDGGANLQT